ncbi:MAG TPA: DUF4126 family protein [Polyangiaceae bacterium]|nr:DUF4126 family protein [Polyangiaceae bacterium]
MTIRIDDPWARAGVLGVATGMRSLTPLAALAKAAREGGEGLPDWLRSRGLAVAIAVAARGEMLFDKLPSAPSRLAPVPLAYRAALGGLVGALAVRRAGHPPALGAGLGAAAAVAGAFAGNQLRKLAREATGLPDAVFAVAEDALALALARAGAGIGS